MPFVVISNIDSKFIFIELRTYFQVKGACSTFWSKSDFTVVENSMNYIPDTQKFYHNLSLINYVRPFVNQYN